MVMDELNEKDFEIAMNSIHESIEDLILRSNSICINKSAKILLVDEQSEFDRLLASAIMRSSYLSQAFHDLIMGYNYMAALHIVRLNLDNALRIYAGFLSEDTKIFAQRFIEGVSVRNLKDKDDKKMNDGYLATKLSIEFYWVKPLYKKMSGFIHFSDDHYKHIFNSDGSGYLGDNDNSKIGPEERLDVITDMKKVNELLYLLADRWLEKRIDKD
jgi:hypothetical protein